MKPTNFFTLIIVLCILFIESTYAEIKLPAVVSSNMVLQRNTTVVLWGWADANEKITIKASWLSAPLNIESDKDGNWKTEVETTNSKEVQSISITSNDSNILLENVLFGEVWICSGQSNMQQPLTGYTGQPTFEGVDAIIKAGNSNLRIFTVDRIGSKTVKKNLIEDEYIPWQEATSSNVADFSAVAYFFGQQLQEILDVPVGLIHTSWGGSEVQPWISKEKLSAHQEINLEGVDINERTNHIPTALYNAMIHPLIPYTIKGALWYQGESNRLEPEVYTQLFPVMVEDWRNRWNIGDFPFYFTQIAPFKYNDKDAFEYPENTAYIRESQLKCADIIPNSGIAITMDIGKENFIHPPKKKEVADRLLFNALNQTYGYENVDGKSPVYESLEIDSNEVLLNFKNADEGLFTFNELQGFEIAGEDKVFYPAEAKIVKGTKVLVKNDKVSNPIAVRYCWQNWINGTLFDSNLLPASSFRTDQWNDATRVNQ